jgi:hypothetical protein
LSDVTFPTFLIRAAGLSGALFETRLQVRFGDIIAGAIPWEQQSNIDNDCSII